MSSSGPMQTAAIAVCAPTTCSSAAMNSAARRPCVTRTMPIIYCPSCEAAAEIPVVDGYVARLPFEPSRQPVCDMDRPVPSAGAADADGQIALSFAFVARQQRRQPSAQAVEKRREIGISLDIGTDFPGAAGKRLQFRDIMRIAEKKHIENHIGVARQAMTKGKRSHENRQARFRVNGEMAMEDALQIARRRSRGIDNEVGAGAQGRNQAALQ